MRSAVAAFVHATLKYSQKVPCEKSGTFWFPRMDSMIQVSFISSCTALQYETGMKFFHRAVPKLHDVKNSLKFCYFIIETSNKIHINQ